MFQPQFILMVTVAFFTLPSGSGTASCIQMIFWSLYCPIDDRIELPLADPGEAGMRGPLSVHFFHFHTILWENKMAPSRLRLSLSATHCGKENLEFCIVFFLH